MGSADVGKYTVRRTQYLNVHEFNLYLCEIDTIVADDIIVAGYDTVYYRDEQCMVDGVVSGYCAEYDA